MASRVPIDYIAEELKKKGFGQSSPSSGYLLCGLDDGSNLPGVTLREEINKLIANGVAANRIIWFSTGTELAQAGFGALSGVSRSTSTTQMVGIGFSPDGVGLAGSVSTSVPVNTVVGVGTASGNASVGSASTVASTTAILGAGDHDGYGLANRISLVTAVNTVIGASTASGGSASFVGLSVVVTATAITGNAAPYATNLTFSNFMDPINATASMAGVSVGAITGTLTGIGESPNGLGTLTEVSFATAVNPFGSNAAPFITSVTFNNFS